MTKFRYSIFISKRVTVTIGKGTKWETKKFHTRKYKTGQVLMIDPEQIEKLFRSGKSFRMACLGFKNVVVHGYTTVVPGYKEHELIVREVTE